MFRVAYVYDSTTYWHDDIETLAQALAIAAEYRACGWWAGTYMRGGQR